MQNNKECKKNRKVLMAASVASMISQFNLPNIRLLQELGYEVHVACNFREGNTCDQAGIHRLKKILSDMHVQAHQWDCPRKLCAFGKCFQSYLQLYRLTERYSFRMIHCHSPIGGVIARIVAHIKGIPVIYTAHGFHFYKGAPWKNWLLYYPVEKLLAYWTDVLIVLNQEDYEFAKRNLHAKKICRTLGVGIDVERFAEGDRSMRRRFRKKLGIPQNAVLLLSVGELSRRKNHRAALAAVAALHREDVYYVICGRGSQQERLYAYAKRLGIVEHVRLAGYVEHTEDAYYAADIFVFPSLQEGLPVALLEAMASGLPVAASSIRGNTDLLDCEGGILAEAKDAHAFAGALSQMLQWREIKPQRLQQMGLHNYQKSFLYDIKGVSSCMKAIYVDMTEKILRFEQE